MKHPTVLKQQDLDSVAEILENPVLFHSGLKTQKNCLFLAPLPSQAGKNPFHLPFAPAVTTTQPAVKEKLLQMMKYSVYLNQLQPPMLLSYHYPACCRRKVTSDDEIQCLPQSAAATNAAE